MKKVSRIEYCASFEPLQSGMGQDGESKILSQTMEAMKEATGIDMRDIVRANSIEAKTDRNITIKTEPEGEE